MKSKGTQEAYMERVIQEPMVMSIPSLAVQTGLSEALLYQRANSGTLPGCRRVAAGLGNDS